MIFWMTHFLGKSIFKIFICRNVWWALQQGRELESSMKALYVFHIWLKKKKLILYSQITFSLITWEPRIWLKSWTLSQARSCSIAVVLSVLWTVFSVPCDFPCHRNVLCYGVCSLEAISNSMMCKNNLTVLKQCFVIRRWLNFQFNSSTILPSTNLVEMHGLKSESSLSWQSNEAQEFKRGLCWWNW